MPTAVPTAWWVRIPVALALALAALVTPGMIGTAHAAPATAYVYAYDAELSRYVIGAQVDVFTVDPTTQPDAAPIASVSTVEGWADLQAEEGQHWVRVTKPGYLTQIQRWSFDVDDDPYHSIYLELDPAQTGTISGRVIDNQGVGFTSGRARVEFYDVENGENSSPSRTTHTESGGGYSALLLPGTYKVKIDSYDERYPAVWVGGTSWETAQGFAATAQGTVATGTTTVHPAVKIAGTVKDTAGKPIRHAVVELYRSGDEWEPVRSESTSKTGAYALHNIAPGTYKLRFADTYGDYVGEWYDDDAAADFATAPTITIGIADVTASAVLAGAPILDSPAKLTGVIQDTAGAPVRAAFVEAYRKVVDGEGWSWNHVGTAQTNRNGRYAFDNLEPGSYSVQVHSDPEGTFEPQWYLGKYHQRSANTVVVPADGSVTAQPMTVVRFGRISGRISQPVTPDVYESDVYAEIYDVDGTYVDYARIGDDGTYTSGALLPGDYIVRAAGHQYVETEDEEYRIELVSQYWRNAHDAMSATKVKVGPDAETTGIDISLSTSLTNVAKPAVSGTGAYGTKLSASTGTWNRSASTVFGYQWTRNGAPIAGATKATYTTTAADLGRKVAVKVTATDKYEMLTAGSATSAAKVVKGKATVGVSAKGAKKLATVKVKLALQGVSGAKATGTVRIYDGKKLKKTVTVRKGNATVTLTGLKKGKHTLTVKFAGSGSHTAASATKRVTVK